MNPLSIWTVLSKLNHYLSSIDNSPVELIHSLGCLILILITNKSEAARIAGPSVSGDEDVDDLAVLVEEREEIVRGGSYAKKIRASANRDLGFEQRKGI